MRLFEPLWQRTEQTVHGTYAGSPFAGSIGIPDYGERITHHYRDLMPKGLSALCESAAVPFRLSQFGLVLSFVKPTAIPVHGTDMKLSTSIRGLVNRFGPVIFRNAHIKDSTRTEFHRNTFSSLRFHVDRGGNAPNQYSCFTRDPLDAEQKMPRKSSTLFIANIVAWAELVRTGTADPKKERGVRPRCDLFGGGQMKDLLGDIILEQPWNQPAGTGEIAVIDNRTLLHASFHRNPHGPGYPIGTRYLV